MVFQPFYRIHFQNEAKYFAPYQKHNPSQEYYTSDIMIFLVLRVIILVLVFVIRQQWG